jgi:NADPH2:quinone reductase
MDGLLMRAAQITKLGTPPTVIDVEAPTTAGPGELLIDVLAGALNPIDIAVASGGFFAGHPELPYVPGAEAVGRVIAGDGIAAGSLVYISGSGFGTTRVGGLAERIVAPRDATVELPPDTEPGLAAALGIAGLAGWLPLSWRAPVRRDDRVLVLGATGTAGLVAVQAARLLGAERVVAAGRRPDALERAKAAGADATVELGGTVEELAERFRDAAGGDGPTLIYDPLWGEPATAAALAAAPEARIVNLGQSAGATATIPSGAVRGKHLEILGYFNFRAPVQERVLALREMLRHAAAGRHKVPLHRVPHVDHPEAWGEQAAGPGRKIVIDVAT